MRAVAASTSWTSRGGGGGGGGNAAFTRPPVDAPPPSLGLSFLRLRGKVRHATRRGAPQAAGTRHTSTSRIAQRGTHPPLVLFRPSSATAHTRGTLRRPRAHSLGTGAQADARTDEREAALPRADNADDCMPLTCSIAGGRRQRGAALPRAFARCTAIGMPTAPAASVALRIAVAERLTASWRALRVGGTSCLWARGGTGTVAQHVPTSPVRLPGHARPARKASRAERRG